MKNKLNQLNYRCLYREIVAGLFNYDDNGNLITDKRVSNVEYNYLNLPYKVTFRDGNTIEWIYDASGRKLRKIVKEGGTVEHYTQDYFGGIEYRGQEVEAIYHAEGRATLQLNNTFKYEYVLRDHLGNSRVIFADNNNDDAITEDEVLQESHYYPFGMTIDRLSETYSGEQNDYQYNGKELNNDFGLSWMDYGARFYDPQIGRWNGVDPLAESYSSYTPYSYTINNPIKFIDPDGMRIEYAGDKERQAYLEYEAEVNRRVDNYDANIARLIEKNTKSSLKRADKLKNQRSNNIYVKIQEELSAIKGSEDIFRIRMGKNVSAKSGGGNIRYNPETGEIDVNLQVHGDFTETQKMSHELLHAHQYLSGEVDFKTHNGNPGELYDITDEIAAFERQNLFTPTDKDPVNPGDFARERYPGLASESPRPKSYSNLSPKQKAAYDSRLKGGYRKIGGWRNF